MPFVKGKSGNPEGSRAHKPEKRALRNLTEQELSKVMNLVLFSTPAQLQEAVNQNPTVLKATIASALAKGIKNGDLTNLMILVDRLLGRVKERLEISRGGMSEDELDTELTRIRALNELPAKT